MGSRCSISPLFYISTPSAALGSRQEPVKRVPNNSPSDSSGVMAGVCAVSSERNGEKLGSHVFWQRTVMIAADGECGCFSTYSEVMAGILGGTALIPGWATAVIKGGGKTKIVLLFGMPGTWKCSSFSFAISLNTEARGWNLGSQLRR